MKKLLTIIYICISFAVSAQRNVETFATELDSIYAVYTPEELVIKFDDLIKTKVLTAQEIQENSNKIGHLLITKEVPFLGVIYQAYLKKD